MRSETVTLPGDSPGTTRTLTRHVWGSPGARPKVHIQAALHADEMPGVIAALHLMDLLDAADVAGEIGIVPLANPIGLSQWIAHKPQGRQEMESLQNANRHYPDLAEMVQDEVGPRLTGDSGVNVAVIRAAMAAAIDRAPATTDLAAMRLALLRWSHDADIVLDLHCDHFAILHLYASPARPDLTSLLCRSTGATLALIAEVSGGNAFDEAHTAPWAALARAFPDHPIPPACFSTTLEYRGQLDVDDATGRADAENLLTFLTAAGAVRSTARPRFPDAPHLPLAAAPEVFAPQGGVVTWTTAPGDRVAAGQVIAHVTDAATRVRLPVTAPCDGILFRQELWRACLRGQGLGHIAGENIVRGGNLLSD